MREFDRPTQQTAQTRDRLHHISGFRNLSDKAAAIGSKGSGRFFDVAEARGNRPADHFTGRVEQLRQSHGRQNAIT
jgi:hypothetical protein